LTAVHYAIELERFEYLVFLLEGDFNPKEAVTLFSSDFEKPFKPKAKTTKASERSLVALKDYNQKLSNHKFVWDSLHSLDVKTFSQGFTPYHLAITKGNLVILRYLIKIYKQRDLFREAY